MLVSKEVKKPVVSKEDKRAGQGIKRPDNLVHSSLFLQRYVGNSALQPPPTKLQRQAVGEPGGFEAPPIVHEVLRSPGQPLDEQTRTFMESRFGYNFGPVQVHTDDKAAESARAVSARAYTVGRHVVMGQGEYAPGTDAGRRLLAHELVHVVQQSGGERLQKLSVGAVGDVYEREAEGVAERVVGVEQLEDGKGKVSLRSSRLMLAAVISGTGSTNNVIEVHVRPKGMGNILEWAYIPNHKGEIFSSRDQFDAAAGGFTRFRYNPNAPRHNIVFLERAEQERLLYDLNQSVTSLTENFDQENLVTHQSQDGGQNNNSLTSVEKAAQEFASLAGLISLTFSEGDVPKRSGGVAGGMNESGSTDPTTQIIVATLQIAISVTGEAKNFLKLLREAAIQGAKKLVFRELTSEIAEEIVKKPKYAKFMATYFAQAGHVGRYSALSVFTRGHGGVYQAHHIVEGRVLRRKFGWSDKAVEEGPAVILAGSDHIGLQGVHSRLSEEMPTENIMHMTKDQILKVYEDVYEEAGYGYLIPTIRQFFRDARVAR